MRNAAWLVVLLSGLVGVEARGCAIPVFRYALDHWKPSSYTVYVYHRGSLGASAGGLVRQLQEAGEKANGTVTVADVAGKLTPEVEKVWLRHGQPLPLPCVVVFSPADDEKSPPTWSGPLEDSSVRRLLDSPVRRQIVKLLTAGESVVWVLLSSDDKKADAEVAALLRRELPRLQKVLELPEPKKDDPDLLSSLPLRISFPVLRLSRTAAEESFLVQTLLQSEDGLSKVKGPILFPIFGRGRALLALHGEYLTATQLERWASFLCSACSCKVKEANPGIDLLIRADWDDLLQTNAEESPDRVKPTITAPPIPPGAADEDERDEPPPQGCRCWLWGGVAGSGVLAVLAGVWLLRCKALGGT